VLAVGDCEGVDGQRLLGTAIHADADCLVAPAEEGADAGDEEAHLPAEGLGPRVDRTLHLPADPEAGDVHEVPLTGAAVGPGEADAADVERANAPLEPGAALAERAVEPEGSPEVTPGPAGNEGEASVRRDRAALEEPVHHLVEGAVASHGDDAAEAAAESLGGEGGGMAPAAGGHAA